MHSRSAPMIAATGESMRILGYHLETGEDILSLRTPSPGIALDLCHIQGRPTIAHAEKRMLDHRPGIGLYDPQASSGDELVARLDGHAHSVVCLATFSGSVLPSLSNLMVSGGADQSLVLWDVERGKLKCRFARQFGIPRCVCVIESRGWICSGSQDCHVRLFDARKQVVVRYDDYEACISAHHMKINDIVFGGRENPLLFSCTNDTIRMYDLVEVKRRGEFNSGLQNWSLLLHPTNPFLLFVGRNEGMVTLLDVRNSPSVVKELKIHQTTENVTSVVHVGNSLFASCSDSTEDRVIRLWDENLREKELPETMEPSATSYSLLCLSPLCPPLMPTGVDDDEVVSTSSHSSEQDVRDLAVEIVKAGGSLSAAANVVERLDTLESKVDEVLTTSHRTEMDLMQIGDRVALVEASLGDLYGLVKSIHSHLIPSEDGEDD